MSITIGKEKGWSSENLVRGPVLLGNPREIKPLAWLPFPHE